MATNKVVLEESAAYWWLLLLQGIAALLIGWWLITRPIGTTIVLVQFLGLYWIVAGIVDVIRAVVDSSLESRGWRLFGGVVGIIAGMFVLNNTLFAGVLTPAVFLWIIAFTFIVNGVVKMLLGNREAEELGYERSWGTFFVGVFYIILGVLLLGMPLAAKVATMVLTAGILAIVGGIGMMIFSLRLRKIK